jgi:hypothetical protein
VELEHFGVLDIRSLALWILVETQPNCSMYMSRKRFNVYGRPKVYNDADQGRACHVLFALYTPNIGPRTDCPKAA